MRSLSLYGWFYNEKFGIGGFVAFLIICFLFLCPGFCFVKNEKCKSIFKYLMYFNFEMALIMLYSNRLINYITLTAI